VSASIFVVVDDKHVPLYRIMWIADTPHFCGNEDCSCEGDYEVRLEQDESVWASRPERDKVLKALEEWYNGDHEPGPETDIDPDPDWEK
jgi:hypothetical protein